MNNSPLPKVLLVILALLSVLCLWYCWSFRKEVTELRRTNAEMSQVNYKFQVFQALMADAGEYSKHNAAIEPILRSVNPANAAAAAAAAQTAAKPSSSK